ncbi:hypothetical protein [Desulfuromonas sp. AOP6]|uniref:hypothetical protein n=1 Tax=Desulfuromonas sp. AOP6 TaxID=1566351 RepID=UPI00126D14E1|nr:hypothetical protein [Desulfuromonas sp. AOP6]BCA80187.1 hypothetical protein AOP6_1974 [Desulfuromonas sp. AOP6]
MKRLWLSVFIALGALILLGMGGGPQGSVPEPDENYTVSLQDRSGTRSGVSQFSMDGNTYFEGWLGDGKVTVFFRNLKSVEFGDISGENVHTLLALKTGETLKVTSRKRAMFYGKTSYGNYQIRASDIARIDFQ